MRNLARQTGADYLFLFGGTIDRATTNTALSLADLTIVGAFIVPSKRVAGEARASGTLVDVQTGQAMLIVSAERKDQRLAPTAAEQNSELKMSEQLRDQLASDLVEQLKSRVRAVAGVQPRS